jgi:RNA polymerase sigma factor (TIGR02999 family)
MPDDFSATLSRARRGDPLAAAALFPQIYGELRRIAASHLRGASHTLQPTALVHEAYERMVAAEAPLDRGHFMAVAARAMRQILIDHARRKGAAKRGKSPLAVTLSAADAAAPLGSSLVEMLALEAALTELAGRSARQAQILELTSFGGLTATEVADELGISPSLVEKELRRARAWLRARLEAGA